MHSSQKLFHYPVDVTARGCSEYYQRITNPVDLESLEKANQHFDFKSIQSIQKALQRMFSNCESFNRDSSIFSSALLIYSAETPLFVIPIKRTKKARFVDYVREAVIC